MADDAGRRLTVPIVEIFLDEHFWQEGEGPNSIGFGPLILVREQRKGGPINKKVVQSHGHFAISECLVGHISR